MRLALLVTIICLPVALTPLATAGCHPIIPGCGGPIPPGPVPVDLPGGFTAELRDIVVIGVPYIPAAVMAEDGTLMAAADAQGAVGIWFVSAQAQGELNVSITFERPNAGIAWTGDPDHELVLDTDAEGPHAKGSPFTVTAEPGEDVTIPVTVTIEGESIMGEITFSGAAPSPSNWFAISVAFVLGALAMFAFIGLRKSTTR